jgi:CheY-like chemotaxis protein
MTVPLRALIVEDSADDTALLVRELRHGGYDVTFERVDSPHALDMAISMREWDIVICDYSMPHFSGTDALKLLHHGNVHFMEVVHILRTQISLLSFDRTSGSFCVGPLRHHAG